MRRTQLYLDEDLWKALRARARTQKTTLSELVREAAREKYLGARDQRMKAMQAFVGSRKEGLDRVDAVEAVRELRKGERVQRLHRE